MASFSEIMKQFQQFQQNTDRIKLQRTLSEANEAAETIRNSEAKEAEKLAQIRSLGREVSFQLIGSGLPASSVEQFRQALDPQVELRQAQTLERTKAELKQRPAGDLTDRARDRVLKQSDTFRKTVASKEFESLSQVDKINTLLDQSSAASFNLAKIGLVKLAGESGRLSDQDLRLASPNPSVFRELRRKTKLMATGEIPDLDRDEFRTLGAALAKKTRQTIGKKAKRFSQSRAKFVGIPAEELETALGIPEEPGAEARESISFRGPNGRVVRGTVDAEGIIYDDQGKPVARRRR